MRWTWVAAASAQPFDTARFDLVMACNVSMDIEDLPSALKEIRRVMRPDGPLSMSVVHPFADRGCFATMEADASLVIEGSYFGRQRLEGVQEHDGLQMHFAGWSQPLEASRAALEAAGLAITALREPLPGLAQGRQHLARWIGIPLFLRL